MTGSARPSKPVRESRHETSELMMPHHANNLGHVFGGVMLSMMDKTAAVAAFRHCRMNVVTASIDRVDFREPIHVGDLVVMKASVNFVGRTSMEVGVRVEAEELLSGRRRHTNSCYLTFVAVDRNGKPMEIPGLVTETPDEMRRHQAAEQRRKVRLAERESETARRDDARQRR
jgi:acyl-CoA hydrolase